MSERNSHISGPRLSKTSRLRVIVTGLVAQHPRLGGIAWHYMQYVLGLIKLGHEVFYFEDSGEWPYLLAGGSAPSDWIARDAQQNLVHLSDIMGRFGLSESWAYHNSAEDVWYGMPDRKRQTIVKTADVIINVSGSLVTPSAYRERALLVYIDTDPVFTQAKIAMGERDFAERVASHDIHFSFGETLSGRVPSTQFYWRPTRQPVVLDEWITDASPRPSFTTIMSWTSYRPLTWKGKVYGQKDLEFRKFHSLPRHVPQVPLELAIGSIAHPEWQADTSSPLLSTLEDAGWNLVNALQVCPDLDSYKSYVVHSKGEWSVAKQGYVHGQPGWFSERSACYLAAGRPVILQDTGFTSVVPAGRGVLSFSTLDEAANAIKEVSANYDCHSRAASEIAAGLFASDRVLKQLLDASFSTSAEPPRTNGGADRIRFR